MKSCNLRCLLIPAGLGFIYLQIRLFSTQSAFADRLTTAVEAEKSCTIQTRALIDRLSKQRGQILALEEQRRQLDDECKQGILPFSQNFLVEGKQVKNLISTEQSHVAAVVVMACNRADYLERTMNSILKFHGSVASKYPLFISQDGSDYSVRAKAMSYNQVTYMQHLDSKPIETEHPGEIIAYYKIARTLDFFFYFECWRFERLFSGHYKWALDRLFDLHNFGKVIILEDDMEIAPDFFDYFEAAAALLDNDKSIMAVSSWNDNGQKQFVHDPLALYRSDFFPGLGWMLTKQIWNELSPKWPKAYWDDWLRLKENHRGRQFVRPEICRTYNFGEHGSSMGQFFKRYLEPIKLNDVTVDWKSMNLSYLTEDKFMNHFGSILKNAKPVRTIRNAGVEASNVMGDVRIQYNDIHDFEVIAQQFGVFEEWKDGIPRTSYKGVVVFRFTGSKRIFLVGPSSLSELGIPDY